MSRMGLKNDSTNMNCANCEIGISFADFCIQHLSAIEWSAGFVLKCTILYNRNLCFCVGNKSRATVPNRMWQRCLFRSILALRSLVL